MWENAQLFDLLNIVLADGYIGSFGVKHHYNYWRPVTAIRLAASGIISAKRSRKALSTGGRLAIAPSITSCGRWIEATVEDQP